MLNRRRRRNEQPMEATTEWIKWTLGQVKKATTMVENHCLWVRIGGEFEQKRRIGRESMKNSRGRGESMENLSRRDDELKKNYLNERNSCFTQLCLLNDYFTPSTYSESILVSEVIFWINFKIPSWISALHFLILWLKFIL